MKILCNDVMWFEMNQSYLHAVVEEASLDSDLNIRLLDIVIVSKDEMFSQNLALLNHGTDTDVITIVNKTFKRLDVQLIINKDFENNQIEHFVIDLILHGLLHALGWKDDLPILKHRMLAKQNEIINKVFHVEQKQKDEQKRL